MNASGYEEFSDDEIAFGDDDFDQEVWLLFLCVFCDAIHVNYTV